MKLILQLILSNLVKNCSFYLYFGRLSRSSFSTSNNVAPLAFSALKSVNLKPNVHNAASGFILRGSLLSSKPSVVKMHHWRTAIMIHIQK